MTPYRRIDYLRALIRAVARRCGKNLNDVLPAHACLTLIDAMSVYGRSLQEWLPLRAVLRSNELSYRCVTFLDHSHERIPVHRANGGLESRRLAHLSSFIVLKIMFQRVHCVQVMH